MINVKRNNNPFKGPLAKTNSDQVGANYADRRRHASTQGITSRPAPQTPRDQFARSQKAKNVGNFDANASYNSGRKKHAGAPHKPGKLEHMERGSIPRSAGNAVPPSDPSLLKFLNVVIEKKELHNRRTIQDRARSRATGQQNASKTASAKKTAASRARSSIDRTSS